MQIQKLTLDLTELAAAFEEASGEVSYYLSLETGQVIRVTDEIRRELEEIDQQTDDEGEPGTSLTDLIQQRDRPEWEKQALAEAAQVEAGYGTRYIHVPKPDPREGHRDMEAFIDAVPSARLRAQLSNAIQGRGAFRRFRDGLAADPRERERWFAFKGERVRRRVLAWLASVGLAPIIEPPLVIVPASPPPAARARLIAEALTFVRAARQLLGVTRIALIGSLTTNEPDPKDADLLVTVTDDADLAPVAALGRKLQGHAQAFNRGGEVFLADLQGHYLGRTCPWKACGPGIRASCDALHCGRRPYLHDDLETLRLAEKLMGEPAIELWPQVMARVVVPDDVEQRLLALLRE